MTCQKPGGLTDFKVSNLCILPYQHSVSIARSLELTLTAKTRNEVNRVLAYLKGFVCVLMLAV